MGLYMCIGTLNEGDTYIRSENELLYWNGAHSIHNWFVNQKQIGAEHSKLYPITKKDLEDLLAVCKKVMENNALSSILLPSSEKSYTQRYFERIELTIDLIEMKLEYCDLNTEKLCYQADW
ncbi:hypothetical protein SIM22_03240 [Bacillus cereus group sp. BfR-BA-01363]|uniref:hypothetical protein n=1 Tax=Bacillus cereus group sp. BfR-BA-01363 TaxID=3094882 RepID=UPI0029C4FFB9|nr:hypothetical protein [Bacillus cereus group sp. BfR-BA-01363]MDX5853138.1 hypothetical protein [Bacillus cereus group sp. BfR-BA-01363]